NSVRIVSSVKGGSSHCVVRLTYTRLSPRLLLKYPTADEYTPTRSQSQRAVAAHRQVAVCVNMVFDGVNAPATMSPSRNQGVGKTRAGERVRSHRPAIRNCSIALVVAVIC